jgi:RNA recognition motif-containing protein
MPKKIYVGNLPYSYSQEQLTALFQPFGALVSAAVMIDRETGKPRGFGFVTMAEDQAAANAIAALDGKLVDGRTLRVNEARERDPNSGPPRTGGGPRPPRDAGHHPAHAGGNSGDATRRGPEERPERDWTKKPKSAPKPVEEDFGPRHRRGGGGSRKWDDFDDE